MQDLAAQIDELTELMTQELDNCRKSGVQLAENEAEYRKMLRIEILAERAKGTPVTVIGDICRGKEAIADAKLRRDTSEALYKASQEAINVYKIRLRMLNAQVQRIWTSGGVVREDFL